MGWAARLNTATSLQLGVALFIALPVLMAVYFGLTSGGGSTWAHIVENRLLPYTATTLMVLALSALLMLAIALPAAWCVSLYDFPGRAFFEWALFLPLAAPGYVLAYAWADLAGIAGPLQSSLRDMTGWSARDYWFPDLFTVPGLAFILAAGLFPYVYITARAAFATQSLATLEAGRSLGVSGGALFWRVGLPAARPAIIAGLALALMEAAADYGAADFLGIQTLGVGIVRAWTSFGEPATAARLAIVLIAIAFAFLIVSRYAQGQAGAQHTSSRWTTPSRAPLTPQRAWLATSACSAILAICFGVPIARLVWLSVEHGSLSGDLVSAITSSLSLAALGTGLAFAVGLALVVSAFHAKRNQWINRLASSAGYAAPGVVLGLGGLFLLSALGLSLSGGVALALLVWIYASRFTAAGTEPLNAALARAPRSLDDAARSLGARGLSRIVRFDLPLLWPGILPGLLLIFVEILKELPATLMLRPFGWDTLAVRTHAYASDERLAEATLPALLITLAGLLPIIFVSRQLTRSGQTNS